VLEFEAHPRNRRKKCLAAVVRAGVLSLWLSGAQSFSVLAAPGSYTYETYGFDKACAPTNAQMDAFWSGTPYYHMYVYIGGSNRACKSNTNLTAAWVDRNGPASSKWGLMPIWVGLQPPCTTGNFYTFSTNTTTAFNQGSSEASAAFSAAIGLNFAQTTPIVFDIEPWATTDTTCVAAAKAFVRGWTTFLHSGASEKAGVYGSTCASGIDKFWDLSPALDWVWGAKWDADPSTSNFGSCVSGTHWTAHQRHKQYAGPHTERWNNVPMTVDSDCANGPMFGVSDRLIQSDCL
jgi:hypothetical protein